MCICGDDVGVNDREDEIKSGVKKMYGVLILSIQLILVWGSMCMFLVGKDKMTKTRWLMLLCVVICNAVHVVLVILRR